MVYNKLIRDKIPQIIEQNGKKAVIETVTEEEYIRLSNKKLDEELKEFMESQSVEELADLVEVVYAILDYKNVSKDVFETIRQQNANESGTFKERLLLKEVLEG